jgi:hypothetical protein
MLPTISALNVPRPEQRQKNLIRLCFLPACRNFRSSYLHTTVLKLLYFFYKNYLHGQHGGPCRPCARTARKPLLSMSHHYFTDRDSCAIVLNSLVRAAHLDFACCAWLACSQQTVTKDSMFIRHYCHIIFTNVTSSLLMSHHLY